MSAHESESERGGDGSAGEYGLHAQAAFTQKCFSVVEFPLWAHSQLHMLGSVSMWPADVRVCAGP